MFKSFANIHTAIVTGSNKGIGNGVIELLAKHLNPTEWHVYLTARNVQLGEEAETKFHEKGLEVKFHQLDITEKDSRHTLMEFIKRQYPNGLGILVNNAGIAYKMDSTAPFGEQARVTVATNYTANVDMCLDFLPIMANSSRVVNVVGFLAEVTFNTLKEDVALNFIRASTLEELDNLMNQFISYAEAAEPQEKGFLNSVCGMSKIGLWRATEILAEKYKSDSRRILINSCCPGYVNTYMTSYKGKKNIIQGADTPFSLATIPVDALEPNGKYIRDRKVVEVAARFK